MSLNESNYNFTPFDENNPMRIDDGTIMPNKPLDSMKKEYHINDLIYDQYRVLSEMKKGGKGIVYICQDTESGNEVALKRTKADFNNIEEINRFYHEIGNWIKIPSHVNLVEAVGAIKINLIPYMIMPHIKGNNEYGLTLRDWMDGNGSHKGYTFNFLEFLYIALSICRGILHCQEAYMEQDLGKYVHGDLKLENIFVESSDVNPKYEVSKIMEYNIKITDCGGNGYTFMPEGYTTKTEQTDIFVLIKHILLPICVQRKDSDEQLEVMEQSLKEMFLDNDGWKYYTFDELYQLFNEILEQSYHRSAENILPKSSVNILAYVTGRLAQDKYKIQILRQYDDAYTDLLELQGIARENKLFYKGIPLEAVILEGMVLASHMDFNWERFDTCFGELEKIIADNRITNKDDRAFLNNYAHDIQTELKIIRGITEVGRKRYNRAIQYLGDIEFDLVFNFDWVDKLMTAYVRENDDYNLSLLCVKMKNKIEKLEEDAKDKFYVCRLRYLLARAYKYSEKYELAVKEMEICQKLDEDNLEYLYEYSYLLMLLGRVTKARYTLTRLYRLCDSMDIQNVADRMTLGFYMTETMFMVADFEEASKNFDKYMKHHDNSTREEEAAYKLLIEESIQELQSFREWKEKNFTENNIDEIRAKLKSYVERFTKPHSGSAYYQRAVFQIIAEIFQYFMYLYLVIGEPDLVIKYSDLFISGYDPDSYIAHLYKARGYASKGDRVTAKNLYKHTLELAKLAYSSGYKDTAGNEIESPELQGERTMLQREMDYFNIS